MSRATRPGPRPSCSRSTTRRPRPSITKKFSQFFADATAGALPAFSFLDPDYGTESQENPQNIVVGEALLAEVVHALGASPLWPRTLFVLVYDEHGGYYDHVPPPPTLAPDAVPPLVQPGESIYDGFARYGFRVPAVVVSPYAKRTTSATWSTTTRRSWP